MKNSKDSTKNLLELINRLIRSQYTLIIHYQTNLTCDHNKMNKIHRNKFNLSSKKSFILEMIRH